MWVTIIILLWPCNCGRQQPLRGGVHLHRRRNQRTILIGQSGGEVTILFDKLWDMMKAKGVSIYQLREKCGINGKTVRCLRTNDNMETKTLSKLCSVLDCRLEDIAEYVPDE